LVEYELLLQEYRKEQNYPNRFFYVPPEMINPLALGHKINHPPRAANVLLLDFDIPRTFFPEVYCHYLPYIDYMPSGVVSLVKE